MSNDAAIAFPALSLSALAGYDILASGSIEIRINNDGLGGMSVSGYSGMTGTASMAAMTVSGTASVGNDVRLTLPACDAVGYAGAGGDVELPAAVLSAWTTNPGTGGVTLRQMEVEAVGTVGTVASGYIFLPPLYSGSTGLNNTRGDGVCFIKIVARGHGLTGRLARGGTMAMPSLLASGSASTVSRADAALYFWPMELDAVATVDSSLFSAPLAYDKDAVQ